MIPWDMGVWQPFFKMAANRPKIPSFNGSNLLCASILWSNSLYEVILLVHNNCTKVSHCPYQS